MIKSTDASFKRNNEQMQERIKEQKWEWAFNNLSEERIKELWLK